MTPPQKKLLSITHYMDHTIQSGCSMLAILIATFHTKTSSKLEDYERKHHSSA